MAQVALVADNAQTVKAFVEAQAHDGPSLIIAYSSCIAHGIEMKTSMAHQKQAVDSGYWPLYRFDPALEAQGKHPFLLDSKAPGEPLGDFTGQATRSTALGRSQPELASQLEALAQADIDERWKLYSQLAGVERHTPSQAITASARLGATLTEEEVA